MDIKRQLEHLKNLNDEVTLHLTPDQASCLADKLQWLMREAHGIDIWLAPGGVLDVTGPNANADCFLDCDEEAHYRLGEILEKLGGSFTPHRNGNFAD